MVALAFLTSPYYNAEAVINENITIGENDFQLAVSPTHLEYDIVPGTSSSETFRVRNTGKLEANIKIGVAPMQFSGDTTALGTPRNEILDWTTVSLGPECEAFDVDEDGAIYVNMRVQEECSVIITTDTPDDAPFGEQYMTAFFQDYHEPTEGSVQTILSIGANVYGTNRTGESDGDMCGELIDQNIPFWVFDGPVKTTAKLKNCGRLNFHTNVNLEVFNLFDTKVYEDEIPQDRIMPADTERIIDSIWAKTGIGIYKAIQTVDFLGETYVKEGYIFLIPIWLILFVLACIAITVLVIINEHKKKKKKKIGR